MREAGQAVAGPFIIDEFADEREFAPGSHEQVGSKIIKLDSTVPFGTFVRRGLNAGSFSPISVNPAFIDSFKGREMVVIAYRDKILPSIGFHNNCILLGFSKNSSEIDFTAPLLRLEIGQRGAIWQPKQGDVWKTTYGQAEYLQTFWKGKDICSILCTIRNNAQRRGERVTARWKSRVRKDYKKTGKVLTDEELRVLHTDACKADARRHALTERAVAYGFFGYAL